VFTFVLAITQVNAYLAWVHFTGSKLEFMAFPWKKLAKVLIYNRFVESDGASIEVSRGRKWQLVDHTLVWTPPFARR
jgi:hypothetical protein